MAFFNPFKGSIQSQEPQSGGLVRRGLTADVPFTKSRKMGRARLKAMMGGSKLRELVAVGDGGRLKRMFIGGGKLKRSSYGGRLGGVLSRRTDGRFRF